MSSGDSEKPRIRLAVENDQKEWAKRGIEWPLRDLAANIFRVSRGAGKAWEIAKQCQNVVEGFQAYRDACGVWPSSFEVQEILSVRSETLDRLEGESWERSFAVETIIRGALQVSASRLVGQNTQERRGESELYDGIDAMERSREEARKRRAAAQKSDRQRLKPKAAAPRKKPSAPKAKRAGSNKQPQDDT